MRRIPALVPTTSYLLPPVSYLLSPISCPVQPPFSDVRYNENVRVLVVEDEPRLSRELAGALGAAGYVVDCATDGARADLLAHTERYDAVLLDLGLPQQDGLALLRAGESRD